jgi:hypothetical protein
MNWLVNPTGEEGQSIEGDIMQEHFNFDIEEAMERKGKDFGGQFVRDVISRSIHYLNQLKKDWREGVGLGQRGWKHPQPHTRPKIRKLLATYKDTELHSFQEGQCYHKGWCFVIDFERGEQNLRGGRLGKWIAETTRLQGLRSTETAPNEPLVQPEDPGEATDNRDENENDEEEESLEWMTHGQRIVVDGEIIFITNDELEYDEDPEDALAEEGAQNESDLESEDESKGSVDGND